MVLVKGCSFGAKYHQGSGEFSWYTDLPSHLKEHDIGVLIHAALYKADQNALGQAATIMTGGSSNAWIGLEKL